MRIAAVPPIRYLGTDSTGTAIVGLPQLHVRVECGGCGRGMMPPRWWARQDLNLVQIVPNYLA